MNEEELIKRILTSPEEGNKVVDEIGYDRYLELVKKIRASREMEESVRLARENGVPESEILHNIDDIDNYFMS